MIRRLLAIVHDASRTGAPLTLFNVIEWARREHQVETTVVVLRDGPLVPLLAEVAEVRVVPRALATGTRLASAVERDDAARPVWERWVRRALAPARKVDLVLASSAASLRAAALLPPGSAPLVVHLHELEGVLGALGGPVALSPALAGAALVVVPSPLVGELARRPVADGGLGVDAHRVRVHPGPVDPPPRHSRPSDPDAALVVGCGTVGWRKGTDLFVALAAAVGPEIDGRTVRWAWIGGDSHDGTAPDITDEIALRGLGSRVRLLGEVDDAAVHLGAADALVVTSREDPYPLVAVEAALAGTPVLGFRPGTALLAEAGHDDLRVDDLDVVRLAHQVREVLADPARARSLAADEARAAADATTPLVAPRLWADLEAVADRADAVEPAP